MSESLQSEECRAQSAYSSKACSKPRLLSIILKTWTIFTSTVQFFKSAIRLAWGYTKQKISQVYWEVSCCCKTEITVRSVASKCKSLLWKNETSRNLFRFVTQLQSFLVKIVCRNKSLLLFVTLNCWTRPIALNNPQHIPLSSFISFIPCWGVHTGKQSIMLWKSNSLRNRVFSMKWIAYASW